MELMVNFLIDFNASLSSLISYTSDKEYKQKSSAEVLCGSPGLFPY